MKDNGVDLIRKYLLCLLLMVLPCQLCAVTLSVKDFGAVGNGIADDTLAIQNALGALPINGSVLLVPAGKYLVSATIDFAGKQSFELRGEGIRSGSTFGTMIIGNVPGGDVVRSVGVTSFFIHGVAFRNTSALGQSALHVEGFTNGVIEFCQITSSGTYGLYAPQNTFTFTVRNVTFNGSNNTGIGLVTGAHTTVQTCDITGWDEGVRACGTNVNISGCRIEVNRIGLRLGMKSDGTNWILSRSLIAGNSFEANDTHIRVEALQNSTVMASGMQGSKNAPSGMSKVGIWVVSSGTKGVTFQDLAVGGTYSDVGVRISNGSNQRWRTTQSPSWDVMAGLPDVIFDGCNKS